jgi:hypothetical protein
MKNIDVSFDWIYGVTLGIEASKIQGVNMIAVHLLFLRIFIVVK